MRRIATILVLTLLLASCSGAGDNADGTTTPPPPTTQAAAAGELDAAFDVGGHKLYLRCEGTSSPGSPTIVYLHGLGGDGSDVESINTQLASQARVCTYDRLNVGRSDSDPGRHTGADSVGDLHALLDAAGVDGPYLLVGFSFGGLLAIMYAGTYPDQVMGLVSLDGSLPTDDEVDQLIPKDERAQVMAEQDANQERVEFYRTVDQAKALVAKVPDVPVTYLAARPVELPPNWPVQRMRAFIRAKQVQFTKAVPQGRLVEVQSSHDIDLDQPELVLKEINRILETA
ncbi:MAG TPA: alpha/beta hydrolase [Propionibacteriaceae bacterium]|nr:alpha/beta hydrolase [Propionibacteriaceae bacterium]